MANDSYQLVVRNAPQSGLTPGQVIALEGDVLTLGRDPLSDIVLNDAEISRHHAKLTLKTGGYELQDMGSTNGSFIDGKRLSGEPRALSPGQVIMLGSNVTLVYQATAAEDPMATIVAPAIVDLDEAAAEAAPVEVAPVIEEVEEVVVEEVDVPMPVTAPAEEELVEVVDEVGVGEVVVDDEDMATMMDESPFADSLEEVAPEPEPLPDLPLEPEPFPELSSEPEPFPELPSEPQPFPELPPEPEPVVEPFAVPEPLAATFEDPDERTYVDSAAPVSDYVEQRASPLPPLPDYDEPEKEGGSNRNIIIIAVVALLLICCCLAILSGVAVFGGFIDGLGL